MTTKEELVKQLSKLSKAELEKLLNADTGKTFTEAQIREAVFNYDDGCTSGKVDFLQTLGIEANTNYRFRVTFEVNAEVGSPSLETQIEGAIRDGVRYFDEGLYDSLQYDLDLDVTRIGVTEPTITEVREA